MLVAITAIVSLAGLFGLLLGFTALKFKVEGDPVVDQIDALLPQTQCGQCTFPGCRPYATAIANGEADINQTRWRGYHCCAGRFAWGRSQTFE